MTRLDECDSDENVAGNPTRTRPYLPGLGRFLQVDPVEGGSCNDYDYTCANPINGFDLDGLLFVDGYHASTWALMY